MRYSVCGLVAVVMSGLTLQHGKVALAQPQQALVAQPNSQSAGQITVGAARFTVLTPFCVRLEYAPKNGFVDESTLFANNRSVRMSGAKIVRNGNSITIDTGKMRLVYRPDGQAFNASNLQVTFAQGTQIKSWKPGQENLGYLGGPLPTLDFLSSPVNLPPALLSRDGWAIVDDSGRPVRPHNWIAPRPGGGPPSVDVTPKNTDLDWYLFAYGNDYRAALQSLATISGRVPMPRKEVLGSWYCRWHPYTSDEFRQLVRGYGDHDFPLDIMVMDMDWHTQNATFSHVYSDNPGWTGYTWNRQLLPDAEKLIAEFRKEGVFVTLNDHPHDGIRDHEEVYPEFMRSLGLTPAKGNNVEFNAGDKRYMDAFLAAAHGPKEQAGVDFWWLDWQQDAIFPWVKGVPGLKHLPWLNELYYQYTQKNGLRGQSYSRWGGWGDQRHPIYFSGDAQGSWRMLGFEVPFTADSGNGGCFFWAHDTGAIFGPRDPENYTRWTQFSALSAALRVHSAGDTDRRPWLWGQQNEYSMRVAYHLRSQLMPYIYTSVRQCYDDTVPLLRPMYFSYPTQEAAYHAAGQYLFGDNLLVAPIVSPGVGPGKVAKQSVWFPSGTWFNVFTGERFEDDSQKLVTADLNEMPLYARAGVPLPMQPYTPRMATTPISQLRVRCYPGADGAIGTSSLYEDDGRSDAYQKNGFARTPLSYTRKGDAITVTVGATRGNFQGQLRQRSVVIELPCTTKATSAIWQGQQLNAQYDEESGTNRIEIPAQSIERAISVTVLCAQLDPQIQRDRALGRRLRSILGSASSPNSQVVLASAADLSPEQDMVLATRGIGLIKQVDGPNFADQAPRWEFYAPAGAVKNNQIQVSVRGGSERMRTMKGTALDVSNADRHNAMPVVRFQSGGQSFRLTGGTGRLVSADNVALDAKVSVSSTSEGHTPEAAIDGVARGYPVEPEAEWASDKEKAGATLRLQWNTPQTVDRVQLFDRPNDVDNVTSGILSFSDGSTLEVGALSNYGTMVRFPAKTITSLEFKVTGVSPKTENIGLSEIAVFRAGTQLGTIYGSDNVAGAAKVSASSTDKGYMPQAAVDGEVGGFPNEPSAEWSSDHQREGATLRLEWNTPQTINRIQLFDRPNLTDTITTGLLTFSDGSTLKVNALSKQGTELKFPAKIVTWITFRVTGVTPSTQSAGLAEIAVFRAHS